MSLRHFDDQRGSTVPPDFQGDTELQKIPGLESLQGIGCVELLLTLLSANSGPAQSETQ